MFKNSGLTKNEIKTFKKEVKLFARTYLQVKRGEAGGSTFWNNIDKVKVTITPLVDDHLTSDGFIPLSFEDAAELISGFTVFDDHGFDLGLEYADRFKVSCYENDFDTQVELLRDMISKLRELAESIVYSDCDRGQAAKADGLEFIDDLQSVLTDVYVARVQK